MRHLYAQQYCEKITIIAKKKFFLDKIYKLAKRRKIWAKKNKLAINLNIPIRTQNAHSGVESNLPKDV